LERQRTEDALRHSEERFRINFSNIAIGIELVDFEWEICWPVTRLSLAYMAIPSKRSIPTALLRPDHAVNVVHQDKAFERLRSGQMDEYALERVYRHKDGHIIWGDRKSH